MSRKIRYILPAIIIAGFAIYANAHFQLILPQTDIVENISRPYRFEIMFTHPMSDGPVMEMGKPTQFGVMTDGKKHDLLKQLKAVKLQNKTAYTLDYRFRRPGDYIFYIEPAPYWEPAEGKLIIHYTKVVVDVLGAGEGWDKMVGFPVEIEPLTRPYGLWTGNIFRGIVKQDGKPVPYAEVEVEYYNPGRKVKAPADAFITQVIKTDANGVFSYAVPRAGWWGFAALLDGKPRKGPKGKKVPVELGALIWIKATDMRP